MSGHTYVKYINESTVTDPEVRVAQGHISIWEHAHKCGYEWCIILEDDATINNLLIPTFGSDIMFVSLYPDGIRHKEHYNTEYDLIKPTYNKTDKNCGLVGYCININYTLPLIENYEYNIPIDHYIYNIVQDNQLVTKECKVAHKNGWSIKSKALN
jgi:hypothetical protein